MIFPYDASIQNRRFLISTPNGWINPQQSRAFRHQFPARKGRHSYRPPVRPFHVTRSKPIRYFHVSTTLRCSIAEGPTIPSPRTSGYSETADCVVVGGGISGPCNAQAIANKHAGVAPNVVVTEARDRVGVNITTVERDGYLWEEGPNSFQPSDPILTLVVGF